MSINIDAPYSHTQWQILLPIRVYSKGGAKQAQITFPEAAVIFLLSTPNATYNFLQLQQEIYAVLPWYGHGSTLDQEDPDHHDKCPAPWTFASRELDPHNQKTSSDVLMPRTVPYDICFCWSWFLSVFTTKKPYQYHQTWYNNLF